MLPFDNFGGGLDQDYFADGITEDIITELARWKDFSVIARNSSFTHKGRSVKVQDVAADLGVSYVLEGSVRQANEPHPPVVFHMHDGKVSYMAGEYDRAHAALLKVDPPNFDMLRYLAATCAALGDMEGARSAIGQLLEIALPLTATALSYILPYRHEADRAKELAHLRQAGLPE